MFNLSNETTTAQTKSCLSLKVNFDATGALLIAHIVTLVANSIFAFTAVIGNSLILVSVLRTRSLYSPSNVLLCCLASSDLLVGLIAQPCFVGHKIGELTNNLRIYCITRIVSETTGFMTVGVSTLTLTAISVERYLALRLHLRYREVITCKRVLCIAGSLWVLLFVFAGLRFVITDKVFDATVVLFLLLSLALTPWCYYKIFKTVKRHENQIKVHCFTQKASYDSTGLQPNQTEVAAPSRRKMLKYKKSTVAMLYILGVFLVCYVPILAVQVVIVLKGYTKTAKIAYVYTSTILLINSSFNPMIYCWRMSDIRRAVRVTLNRVIPSIEIEEPSITMEKSRSGVRPVTASQTNNRETNTEK